MDRAVDDALDRAALGKIERGLETARAHALPEEIAEAEAELEDLKQVYDEIDSARVLARGVAEVAKLDPERKDPIVQKRIEDLRATLDTRKRGAQEKAVAARRRPPQLRAPKAAPQSAQKAAPPSAPPQLRAPQPKPQPQSRSAVPSKPAPQAATPPRYGPYPATGVTGVGLIYSNSAWRWFTVYADGRPIVQRGPMWLTEEAAQNEELNFLASTFGRGYIGSVRRWDWDAGARQWRSASRRV